MVGFVIVTCITYTGMGNASADYNIENIKGVKVPKVSTEHVTKVYNQEEIVVWISEINAMLSAPLDDPRLREANNGVRILLEGANFRNEITDF